jgi:hypothetical protein
MEGSMLMDYHLLFILLSFVLLILSIITLFSEKHRKQEFLIPIAFISVNMSLCVICMLGFFSIDLIGFSITGGVQLTQSNDMWSYYILFYVLIWVNTFLLFYGFMEFIKQHMKEDVGINAD